jgi:hypothetical protein
MIQFLSRWPHENPGPCLTIGLVILAGLGTLIVPAGAAFSQDRKPDFSGHWILDKTKSDLGSGPEVENVTENDKRNPARALSSYRWRIAAPRKASGPLDAEGPPRGAR